MNLMLGIAGVFAVGSLYVLLPVFLQTYRSLRGTRTVQCPETREATVIALDRSRNAMAALVGREALRVRQCTRWAAFPWHANCGQECLNGTAGRAERESEETNDGLLTL
jgi:hypothetical protein